MRRKMSEALLSWKKKTAGRKPLLLFGARQVGKTYLIDDFSKTYKHYIYLNFEKNKRLGEIFEEDLNPERIIKVFEVLFKKPLIPEETLIFFDEVQLCPNAVTALKYFCEDMPEIHIVAAGSLLGVVVDRGGFSFPVGKVEIRTMVPLDFEEFLWATANHSLVTEIRRCFETDTRINGAIHTQAMQLYRSYLCTGGMPAVVDEYVRSQSFIGIREVQTNILLAYIADLGKYAESETPKIRTVFQSIPNQLAKLNHKFQYSVVQKGGTARTFGNSIDWLTASGIVQKCRRIEHPMLPLSANADESAFKIYMSDVGLFSAHADIPIDSILTNDLGVFAGAVTENYVAQALTSKRYPLYYWQSRHEAELDFLIQKDTAILPLEVKSSDNTKSKSLDVYMQNSEPKYAIRVSSKNFGFENKIKSVPLFATFCI